MSSKEKTKPAAIKHKTYSFVVFNLRLHPHNKKNIYKDFFNFLKDSNLFKETGYKYNLIGIGNQNYQDFNGPQDAFLGNFIRYTNIYDAPWYNTQKDKIEDGDLNTLIKVPSHLKLDGTIFDFIFFIKPHILVVQIDNDDTATTSNTLEKYFKSVFENEKFKQKFKSAEITAITHSNDIKELLSNPYLKSIEYVIRRPNSDLFGDLIEREVLVDMEESNADEYRFQMDAQRGKNLIIKERTKAIGEIAAENGEVNAQILEPNSTKYKDISTKKMPLKETAQLPVNLEKNEKWKIILSKLKPKVRLLKKV